MSSNTNNSTNELRKKFIEYFIGLGHQFVESSPLVPGNDPTLLFTNAGMVQFKDVFLGHEHRDYKRAVSCQRCIRAGGKHNDLDNVGYTARHHTFFEMLGNFSFGDYFKREAIQYAWEFLTQVLEIPKEKLWVTVHITDQEAEDIWLNEIKIDPTRFSRCDEDNFWSMGDVGPCGPCTEIFYDHGDKIAGGPPGTPEAEGDRYVEIWNLVFMQFNRAADGSMTPLPCPSVDTGMGLERLASVMQGKHSNYDIDLFQTLIHAAAKLAHTKDLDQPSLKVIADHIRATSFLIMDGIRPSNEGRGYVLRRIIRRALRHGYQLGMHEPFFYKLVSTVVMAMSEMADALQKNQAIIEKIIEQEEEQFFRTLAQGIKLFEQARESQKNNQLPGDLVFKLYDTYGFPVDLCADMAREHGLTLDMPGFEQCMKQQRDQSQAHSHFVMAERLNLDDLPATEFTGYHTLQENVTVLAILKNEQRVQTLKAGEEGVLILDKTPFYAVGGGQVGDVGVLGDNFKVENTKKQDNIILHYGKIMQNDITVQTTVLAQVDAHTRTATALNHSATHLLHAALRQVLGTHVVQKGSLVAPLYLRFDFAHFSPVTPKEIIKIEDIVNAQIRLNTEVKTEWLDKETAMKRGAMALFDEKYGDEVRVLTMGGDLFSKELCGGTHVKRTGDIGLFKITQETGIAAGVRRIEAVTGEAAFQYILKQEQQLRDISALLKSPSEQTLNKLEQLILQNKALEKEVERANSKMVHYALQALIDQAVLINDVKVIAAEMHHVDRKTLKEAVEQLLNTCENSVICLASVEAGQIALMCGVSKTLVMKYPAHELVQYVAQQVGGKGGGKPDRAQGAGNNTAHLEQALASVKQWIAEKCH